MRGTAFAHKAKIEVVLVYYDEPQLLLLASDRGIRMIAVAVQRPDMESPFFCSKVLDKAFDRYLDGKADLHYLFREAHRELYYFFDLDEETDGWVSLQKAIAEDIQDDRYWPKVGFFSRNSTTAYHLRPVLEASLQEFKIDGNWEARDFSQFHGKMSDLYALFSILKPFENEAPASDRLIVKRYIRDRFWQGGGSYVGFYDDLSAQIKSVNPLSIVRIQ